ncbi:hypothetical protein D9M68_920750 [compost metagenome]
MAGAKVMDENAGCKRCMMATSSVSTCNALGNIRRAKGTGGEAICHAKAASSKGLNDTRHPAGSRA